MRSAIHLIIFGGLLLIVSGCAPEISSHFFRSDLENMKIGQTTYLQMTERIGQPNGEEVIFRNEKTLKVASYTRAYLRGEAQPLRPGVSARRIAKFYFYNDRLAGYSFDSSVAEDHTDFDDSKRTNIIKGRTTRTDVFQLLGKPDGCFMYPVIKASPGDAAVYTYSEAKIHVFSKSEYFRKELMVTFDAGGVVTDVEFSSSQTSTR